VFRRQVETLGSNVDQVKSARMPHKHPRSQRLRRPPETRGTASPAAGTPITVRSRPGHRPLSRPPSAPSCSAQESPPQQRAGPATDGGRGPATRFVRFVTPARTDRCPVDRHRWRSTGHRWPQPGHRAQGLRPRPDALLADLGAGDRPLATAEHKEAAVQQVRRLGREVGVGHLDVVQVRPAPGNIPARG